jgi:hypothetical protein
MLNTNIHPYYDDFDSEKGFHKILFVPGNPVQARELNQIQSIIQHQIKQNSDHIFKNGTMVIPGNVFFDKTVRTIYLNPTYNNEFVNSVLAGAVDKVVKNADGVSAKVFHATAGTETTPPALFVKYVSGSKTSSSFLKDQELVVIEYDNGGAVVETSLKFKTHTSVEETGGAICYVNEGVFYINGYFVGVNRQVIDVAHHLTANVNVTIGLDFVDSIVTAKDDYTLYDNSFGYTNNAAPGADRYKIELILTKTSYQVEENKEKFVKLLDIVNGNIAFLNDKTVYSEIDKMLSKRMYDHAGDFLLTDNISAQVKHYRTNYRGEFVAGNYYIKGDNVWVKGSAPETANYYYATKTGFAGDIVLSHQYGIASDGNLDWAWQPADMVTNNGGAYVPVPKNINDNIESSNKMNLLISPLTAYHGGREVICHNTQFQIPKTTTTQTTTDNLKVGAGSHILVKNISGVINSNEITQASILSADDDIIGTCWVRSLEWHSGEKNANDIYKLRVFDVSIEPTYTFVDHAHSVSLAGGTTALIQREERQLSGMITGVASSVLTGKNTKFFAELLVGSAVSYKSKVYIVESIINDSAISVSISRLANGLPDGSGVAPADESNVSFPIFFIRSQAIIGPQSCVFRLPNPRNKALRDADGVMDVSYTINYFKQLGTAGGPSISVNAGSIDSFVDGANHVIFELNESVTTIVFPTFELNDSKTVLTVKGLTQGRTYSGNFVIRRVADVSREKTKTLKQRAVVLLNSGMKDLGTDAVLNSSTFTFSSFPLPEADVIRINSIRQSGSEASDSYQDEDDTDVSSSYQMNRKSENDYYSTPSVVLRRGKLAPSRPIKIVFEYFDHTAGDFFSINSYENIHPNMVPPLDNGAMFNLGDVLDFRSRISDSGDDFDTNDGASVSSALYSGSEIRVTSTFYEARYDIITLAPNGKLSHIPGKPDAITKIEYPPAPAGHLEIIKMVMAPNIRTIDTDFRFTVKKYKRYTMADIGKIDSRVQSLEEYVSLSLLEKETTDLLILDSNGLDMFKNGIMVDDFSTPSLSMIEHSDFRSELSTIQAPEIMTPLFNTKHIQMLEIDSTNAARQFAKYQTSGTVATLPYTVEPCISQMTACAPEFINPFNVVIWEGDLQVQPKEDVWTTRTLTNRVVFV